MYVDPKGKVTEQLNNAHWWVGRGKPSFGPNRKNVLESRKACCAVHSLSNTSHLPAGLSLTSKYWP